MHSALTNLNIPSLDPNPLGHVPPMTGNGTEDQVLTLPITLTNVTQKLT